MRLHRYLRNRAIRLTRRVASPMHRWRLAHASHTLTLDQVRRRLELLLVAMYGTPMRVASVAMAGDSDVGLPPQFDASAGLDDAIARYRLLALAQAARLARRDASTPPDDLLARDLHRLAESAAAERELVERVPSLGAPLALLRYAELAGRRKKTGLSHTERRAEALLAALLASPPDQIPSIIPTCATPSESRAWAEATAEKILSESGGRSPYRPRNPMSLWGLAWSHYAEPTDEPFSPSGGGGSSPDPSGQSSARADNATRRAREDDASHEGSQSTPDGTDAGDSVDEQSATLVRSSSASAAPAHDREHAPSAPADTPEASPELTLDESGRRAPRPPADGIAYPEWDEYGHRLHEHGATVTCSLAGEGDDAWAAEVLHEHAPLVRQVRDRFAPLRARRLRLRRQRVGDELDLEACVAALTDRRIGVAPSDRLYQVVRTSRHTMAILLLVDTSGSTATKLDDGRTVLDVERMTLLLAGEALATLGDPYAMLSFSGAGRHGVQVCTIKDFAEHDLARARRRIASLAPRDNTRLGAAVRHATAVLNAQPVQRRVLLVLSDGQPNDVDWYQGAYAVEDSRRAILDARASGVHTFCLTVEQEETEYLPHLFGPTGYRVLSRPDQLPEALLGVVVGMIRS
ncbi:MAG TPA: VWA domain-containing protein [Gemmatimonadaceae bacterium]